MSKAEPYKLVILGSGPAGLTAAIYAARAGISPLVVEGNEPGGQLTITTDVENYPGFPKGIGGPQLMTEMREQALRYGTSFLQGRVSLAKLEKSPFLLALEGGKELKAEALIVATGAQARWLGLESETRLRNRGVSACATCDGFFFKELRVAVVGGGDTAMEEALYLANLCKEVVVVHRRDKLRASFSMAERAKAHPKIRFVWNSVVEEVLGEEEVEGLRLVQVETGEKTELAVKGLFVAIGHIPNSEPFLDQLKSDAEGYLWIQPGSSKSSREGVFLAGDVADKNYRQAITAAGAGCMAALDAERWLSARE